MTFPDHITLKGREGIFMKQDQMVAINSANRYVDS